MSDFKQFAQEAEANLKNLVTADFKDYTQAAMADGQAFLERSRQDLERWLQLRAAGQLTDDDLVWLIKSKKDLAVLQALKQAGMSQTRLDGFKNDLIQLAIQTAAGAAAQGLQQLAPKPPATPA